MKAVIFILFVAALTLFSYGCLTVETKEYRFHLNPDGESGTGTVTFVNILSQREDTTNIAKQDFSTLINDYLKGDKLQEDSVPAFADAKKRLFERDGKLCGEIAFTFSRLADVGIYRYDDKSPVMYFFNAINEEYDTSSGKYGGKIMPVVFWKDTAHDLFLETRVAKDIDNTNSLMPYYTAWK